MAKAQKQVQSEVDDTIIAVEHFIVATRDSGYKGTSSAIAELVDNSIQAGAGNVEIILSAVEGDEQHPIVVGVRDDGRGMDQSTLRTALRFGGSTRFGERTGMGRYGMGLPNSSLSQARRVEVYTWQRKGAVLTSYLDVDEISSGALDRIPTPQAGELPGWARGTSAPSGTLVVWTRCDRLDNRKVSTVARKLTFFLGRVFRHYIWNGVNIRVNGDAVRPIDPLFLHEDSISRGGRAYGDPLAFTIEVQDGGVSKVGVVRVTFSELPVDEWHHLPNEEKRRLGVTDAAGVSVVRAGREIELGWFFMGSKRRENYDDWWRCEVKFEPVLDEAFGITHTKQQVRPRLDLLADVAKHVENVGRLLNTRSRKAHAEVKAPLHYEESEIRASEREVLLEPLPKPKPLTAETKKVRAIVEKHKELKGRERGPTDQLSYAIIEDRIPDTSFYSYDYDDGRLVLILNPAHPWYQKIYKPLCDSQVPEAQTARKHLELMLLAAARAEAAMTRKSDQEALTSHRLDWSHTLASYLKT